MEERTAAGIKSNSKCDNCKQENCKCDISSTNAEKNNKRIKGSHRTGNPPKIKWL